MEKKNLLLVPSAFPAGEFVELLAQKAEARIERIISTGQASPSDFWYDQEQDEWVAVLQGMGTLQWEDGSMTSLSAGESLMIPAHVKHRVEYTSQEPQCIWLAVFL